MRNEARTILLEDIPRLIDAAGTHRLTLEWALGHYLLVALRFSAHLSKDPHDIEISVTLSKRAAERVVAQVGSSMGAPPPSDNFTPFVRAAERDGRAVVVIGIEPLGKEGTHGRLSS